MLRGSVLVVKLEGNARKLKEGTLSVGIGQPSLFGYLSKHD